MFVGDAGGAVLTYEDVSEARVGQRKITPMAYHDALTGLANRRLFTDTLDDASGTSALNLLMIDLNYFKTVNDKYGHTEGDELLVQVAARLSLTLSEGDQAFRLGGDEFAVLLPVDPVRAEELAVRIVETLAVPFAVGSNIVRIGCSIGIAAIVATDDASTVQRRADLALYKAKHDGRGRVEFYREGMFEEAAERRTFVDDLSLAVERGQLELHYQPLYSLPGQQLAGFEALVRWRHPELGMISPARFIPIAEESGAIDRIGSWVMDEALLEASSWPKHLYVSVNVSAVQLRTPNILAYASRAIADYGLSPRQLEIEMTETAMVDNSGQIATILAGFRGLGVRLAMDDFGTGYSSLAHLREFKIDRIKIDRSFISGNGDGADADKGSAAVVRAIMGMARELAIETTAEGIETNEQLERITTFGCGTAQGYLLGRPMEAVSARSLAFASQVFSSLQQA